MDSAWMKIVELFIVEVPCEVLRRPVPTGSSGPWLQVSNRFNWVRPDNGEVKSGREAGGDLTSGVGWSPLRESQKSGNHLLGLVGKSLLGAGEVGVPSGRVPQLHARSGTDDGAVAIEPGILAQRRRDRHPALF